MRSVTQNTNGGTMESRAEIDRRRAHFTDAFNREDLASLRELCTEDIVMMPSNQPPIIGIDAAVEWWTTGFEAFRSALHVTPREVHIANGWAFDWWDWHVSIVPLRGAVCDVDRGSSFWMWRRQHDRVWRVARAMWKSNNEAPSVWAGGVGYFPNDTFPLM
jgi:ketosteroid isomerase-like protein